MYKYIWLVPLLPLIGAAINGLLGRKFRFSEQLIGGIAVGSVALAFLISVAAVYSYGFGGHPHWPNPYLTSQDGFSFNWIPGGAVSVNHGTEPGRFELLNIEWSYQLDPLSAVFMLIVTGVGLCIFIFATGYMHGETGFYRFFAYMGLFMFAMLVLVMGSNFLMMFVGWEGVGLCSYLLIGYYFDRQEAANASRKAFITNRVGDFGFALAIFGIIATFGSAQYTQVFNEAKDYPIELLGHWGILSWIALGLFIGACGKSAQLPLHVWLPDAMAGPTPVSALIHAATMVTAGLYMVTRTNVIFQHSQTMLLVVALVGDGHRDLRGNHRHHAKRHQEGPRILDCFAARFHVHGRRRRRVCDLDLPRDDARVLQGADVPWRGQRDSRHASRAGHASHGRVEEVHALHVLDVLCGMVGDLRHHSVQRLLVQGRDSLESSIDDVHSARLARVAGGDDRRDVYRVLHDAFDGDDVLGQGTVPRETGASRDPRRSWTRGARTTRIAAGDVGAVGCAGGAGDDRRIDWYWTSVQAAHGFGPSGRHVKHLNLVGPDRLEPGNA